MATKIEMWRSGAGNDFETEHDAVKDDLRALLLNTTAINEASAKAAVDFIAASPETIDQIGDVLRRLSATHASQPTIAPPAPLPPYSEWKAGRATHGALPDTLQPPPAMRASEPVKQCAYCGGHPGHHDADCPARPIGER